MALLANSILFSIDSALQVKSGLNVETVTDHTNLNYQSSPYQIISNGTGGAKEVRLPGANLTGVSVKDGCMCWVRCAGADPLTIQKEGGATITTLTTGQLGIFMSSGSSWHMLFKG